MVVFAFVVYPDDDADREARAGRQGRRCRRARRIRAAISGGSARCFHARRRLSTAPAAASRRSSVPPAAARRRCCAASPACERLPRAAARSAARSGRTRRPDAFCRRTSGMSATCSRKRACSRISRSATTCSTARRAAGAAAPDGLDLRRVVDLLGLGASARPLAGDAVRRRAAARRGRPRAAVATTACC